MSRRNRHGADTALEGFKLVRKRPARFQCTLCAVTADSFVMDRGAMVQHSNEAGHRRKAKEKEELECADWNAGAQAWKAAAAEEWGVPAMGAEQELQRWLPGSESQEKQQRILNWIDAVMALAAAGMLSPVEEQRPSVSRK